MPWAPQKHKPAGHEQAQRQQSREYDRQRSKTANRKLYDRRWQAYSKWYRTANPLCVECSREGRTGQTEVVDHIIPHKGDSALFWDATNHQPLCKMHHDRFTATYDGGFGNQRRSDATNVV